mgnify:CR=1 FL=1|jgi:hypothetical protein
MSHHDDHHHHTHDHSHEHEHENSHKQSHSHSHCHGHDQQQQHSHEDHHHSHSHELSFERKLEKLFSHWINHNNSHRETFMTWAERAKEANLTTVAEDIEKAARASGEVSQLLEDALKKLSDVSP